MAGKDVIDRAFVLREHNQSVIDLAEPFTLNVAAGNLSSGDIPAVARLPVHASADGLTLTAADAGIVLMDGASVDYVLPAITDDNIGMRFEFKWTVASTDATITAGTGDLLVGGVAAASTTAGGNDFFAPDGSDDLITTFNGTTKGGAVGGQLTYTAISAASWFVEGSTNGSGTLATPFS